MSLPNILRTIMQHNVMERDFQEQLIYSQGGRLCPAGMVKATPRLCTQCGGPSKPLDKQCSYCGVTY